MYILMGQNKKPTGKPTHMVNDLWQGSQEYTKSKGQSLQQMVLGKLENHMKKKK